MSKSLNFDEMYDVFAKTPLLWKKLLLRIQMLQDLNSLSSFLLLSVHHKIIHWLLRYLEKQDIIRGFTAIGFVGKIVSLSENLSLWPPKKLCSHGATDPTICRAIAEMQHREFQVKYKEFRQMYHTILLFNIQLQPCCLNWQLEALNQYWFLAEGVLYGKLPANLNKCASRVNTIFWTDISQE